MVDDALSCNTASTSIMGFCMSILIVSSLLDSIRKAQIEVVKKKNWKRERLMGEIGRFAADRRGSMSRYRRFWVPEFVGIRHTMLEEAHKSKFSIHP